MEEESSGSNHIIFAFTVLIIVSLIVAALYFSDMSKEKKPDVDVQITVPSR